MFRVWITFLDSMDEYGYPCECYDFNDEDKALAFYALKKSDYKDNGLVDVSVDF